MVLEPWKTPILSHGTQEILKTRITGQQGRNGLLRPSWQSAHFVLRSHPQFTPDLSQLLRYYAFAESGDPVADSIGHQVNLHMSQIEAILPITLYVLGFAFG